MIDRIHRTAYLDLLIREAIASIVRLKSGEAVAADALELIDWRLRSPQHENAFKQAAKLWRSLGHELARTSGPAPREGRRKRRRRD